MHGDRGDVILGWFTKVTVVLAVFGVLMFDAVSVGVAKMNANDIAGDAAAAAADSWGESHDARAAYLAAERDAATHDATVDRKAFHIDADGTVHVTLSRDATTVLLFRTRTTKKWTHAVGTGARRSV
jgi:hypothetical protein